MEPLLPLLILLTSVIMRGMFEIKHTCEERYYVIMEIVADVGLMLAFVNVLATAMINYFRG